MKFKIVILILLPFAFCLLPFPVFSAENIGTSHLSPNSPFYFLKTVKEEIEWKLALTPRVQIIREMEFATRRLREVDGLTINNHQELITATIQRYLNLVGDLTQVKSPDNQLLTSIDNSLSLHIFALENIYSRLQNTQAKMSIRAAINSISLKAKLSKDAKDSACKFFSHEASSSALTEVEKTILSGRAKICFGK